MSGTDVAVFRSRLSESRVAALSEYSLVLLLLGVTTARAAGQASTSELEGITTRGRMLAEYDVAAWTATDEITALNPPAGAITGYVARRGDRGWQITFGHFSAARDTFLVTYVATQLADGPSFTVTVHDPPLPDVDYLLRAARAVEVAR